MTSDHPATLLIVDDDEEIRELLAAYLGKSGFRVLCAADGAAMDACLAQVEPDLIVLDLMLPGEDGFALCRRLRRGSEVPVIMLTASADDTDRIIGLELGADDYLAKPFNPRELLARIKAILRRVRPLETARPRAPPRYLRFGPWTLDCATRVLAREGGDERLELGSSDYTLLLALLHKPLTVLSRDRLYELTRRREATPFDRSLDVQVCRLRARLEPGEGAPQLIKTVRGSGYMLAVTVEAHD